MKKNIGFILLILSFVFPNLTFADQSEAVLWLSQQQDVSGSISQQIDVANVDQSTQEASLALLGTSIAEFNTQISNASDFLETLGVSNSSTELISRRILLNSKAGFPFNQDLAELRSRINPDGGYGSYRQHGSNPLSSSFALLALRAANEPAASTIQFLITHQQANGSWSFSNLADPSNQITAYVLIALRQFENEFNLNAALDLASTFLLSQRNADGLWGDTETSALSLFALIQNEVDRSPFQQAIDSLMALQLANGSFQNDVYLTALITRLLQLNEQPAADAISLSGRVLDGDSGLPLSNVSITLEGSSSNQLLTDQNGRFFISVAEEGAYTLTVSLTDYNQSVFTTSLSQGDQFELNDINLVRLLVDPDTQEPITAGTINGTVTNRINGQPLAGVVVSVDGQPSLMGVTNAVGQYQISNVPAGSLTVRAMLNGFEQLSSTAVLAERQTLLFSPELAEMVPSTIAVFGVILDSETNLPLESVAVVVTQNGVEFTGTTNSLGEYQIAEIPSGFIEVSASFAGYLSVSGSLDAPDGANINFSPSLSLEGSQPVTGTGAIRAIIVDSATGRALNGVTAVLTQASTGLQQSFFSDENGFIQAFGLAPGNATLELQLANYQTQSLDVEIREAIGLDLGVVELSLSNPSLVSTVTGVVLDVVTNQPLSDVNIRVETETISSVVFTDSAGAFNVEGLSEAAVSLFFEREGYITVPLSLSINVGQDVDLANIRMRLEEVETLSPDLALTSLDATQLITDLNTLEVSGALTGLVANLGAQNIDLPFDLIAFIDSDGDNAYSQDVDIILGQTNINSGLAVDSDVEFSIAISGAVQFRDAPIHVFADVNNIVLESNENNNLRNTGDECIADNADFGPFDEAPTVIPTNLQPAGPLAPGINIAEGYAIELFAPNVTTQQGPSQLSFNTQGDLFLALGDSGISKIPAGTNTPEPFGETNVSDSDGLVVDSHDNIIVSGSPVTKYNPAGEVLWEVGCPAGNLQLISVDESDNVYVGSLGSAICKISSDGQMLETIGGFSRPSEPSDSRNGLIYIGQLGPRNIAIFSLEEGAIIDTLDVGFFATQPVFDSAGKLHVGKGPSASNEAAVIDLEDNSVKVIASGFRNARGRAYGPDGNLYIADASTSSIYRVTLPEAEFTQLDDYTASKLNVLDRGVGNNQDVTVRIGNAGRPVQNDVQTAPTYLSFEGDDYLLADNVEPVFEHSIEYWFRLAPGTPSPLNSFGGPGPGGLGQLNGPFACGLGSLFRIRQDRTLEWMVDPAGCGAAGASNIPTPALDEKWNHIAGTYDGSTARLYLNGQLVGEQNAAYTSSTNLIFGTDSFSPFMSFIEADIDEVRLWRRALSQEEISSRICSELEGDEEGLSLYWQLNEGQGEQVNDLSASGNTVNFPAGEGAPSWAVDSEVRPQCRVATQQVDVTLYNGNPSNGGQIIATKVIDAPVGGSFQDVLFSDVEGVQDVQELFAVVDSQDNFIECNEANNLVSLSLDQANTIGSLGLTLGRTVIAVNEELSITSLVSNIGALPANYFVDLKVENLEGDVIANLPVIATDLLDSDSAESFLSQWNSQTTLAGQYQVNAQLRNNLNEIIDSQVAPFSIVSSIQQNISLRTTTDRFTYHINDSVQLEQLVQNLSINSIEPSTSVIVEVNAPGGSTVFSNTILTGDLTTNFSHNYLDLLVLNNAETGDYIVSASILSAESTVLATASTSFVVINNLDIALSGEVEASSPEVFIGETLQCLDTLNNSSNAPTSNLQLRQLLVNLDTETVLTLNEQEVDVPIGENAFSETRTIDTSDLSTGSYACALQAFLNEQWVNLANDFFEVEEPPIDIDLDAQAGSKGRVLVLIDDRQLGANTEPELSEQTAFLEGLLTQAGWFYTIVTTAQDFEAEFATGAYINYLLLSENEKISEQTQQLLVEAVSEGAGLIEAGGENQRQGRIDEALGVNFRGQSNSAQGLTLFESDIASSDNAPLLTPEQVLLAQLDGATAVAQFTPDQARGNQDEPAAITIHEFDDGRSVYFGFDLLSEATLISSNDSLFAQLILDALIYINNPSVLEQAGVSRSADFIVTNVQQQTPARLVVTLPEGTQLISAPEATSIDGNQITWLLNLAAQETVTRQILLTQPAGTITIDALVESGEAPDFVLQATASVELTAPEVSEVMDDLGVAGSFNAFICDDFTSRSSDSHGRLAAGGNITIDSYGVASRLPSQPDTPTLIAGGDLSYGQGKIFVGSGIAGGSIANVNQTVVFGLENGATIEGNVASPIDFEAEFAGLRQLSSDLARVPSTGTVEYRFGGVFITGDCSSDTQVFNLDGQIVLNSNHINLSCVPNDSTIIFNIDGQTAGFKNIGLSQFHNQAPQILYNFHEAQTVQLTHVGIEGSVLAPNAHFDNPRGQVNGSIVAKSWDGPMELHDFPFIGSLESVLIDLPVSEIETDTDANDTGNDSTEAEDGTDDDSDDNSSEAPDNSGEGTDSENETTEPSVQELTLDGLGASQSFNAFFSQDFTSQYSGAEGKMAAGGNVSLNGYSVASRLPSQPTTPTLLAGGDLSFGQGRISVGSALIAGTTDGVNQSLVYGLENGASIQSNATLSTDFETEFAQLRLLSSALAQAPSNGAVEYKYGGIYLAGDCSSDTQVFNLNGSTVFNSNHLVLNCVPNNATIILNIDGQTAGFKNIGLSQLSNHAPRVLYNFHEADTVQLTNVGIEGTVLAPNAHFDNPRGQARGTIIGKSWNGPMALQDVQFTGSLENVLNNTQ